MGIALDECMEYPDFLQKWTDGKFTTRERRVLITKWVGTAWEKLVERRIMHKFFIKTGCLIAVNGTPNRINLQGLPAYKFIPPRQENRFLINVDSSDDEDDSSSDDSEDDDDESSEGSEIDSEPGEQVDHDVEGAEGRRVPVASSGPKSLIEDGDINVPESAGRIFTENGKCWWEDRCTMEAHFKSAYVHVCEFCKRFVHSQCCMANKLPERRFACYQCHEKLLEPPS